MAEDKGTEKERTLEMRVAELEDKLSGMQVTEEEMQAFHKVSSMLGAAPRADVQVGVPADLAAEAAIESRPVPGQCVIRQCIQQCIVQQCTIVRQCTVINQCTVIRQCTVISQCTVHQCTIQQCTIQQCINECAGGAPGGGFGGGGFGGLGG